MIDKIIEGKKRKVLGLNTKKRKLNSVESTMVGEISTGESSELEFDREEILKKELNKSADTFAPPLLVHTFISKFEFSK